MKKKKQLALVLACVMVFTAMIGLVQTAQAEETPTRFDSYVRVERTAGKDRFETSVQTSVKAFDEADNVVIASGRNFADALVGGLLANHLGGPILLADTLSVPNVVKEEIKRLDPENIFIVGGENSVSLGVEEYLKEYDENLTRLAGQDRIKTSIEVANFIKGEGEVNGVAYANGYDFPDALAGAAYVSSLDNYVLQLTDGKSLGSEGPVSNNIILLGGRNSIDIEMYDENRLSGHNRYDTAVAIAEKYDDFDEIVLVDGKDYPDALSAINLMKEKPAPILLVKDENLEMKAHKFISDLGKDIKVNIVGGENSVAKNIEKELGNALREKSRVISTDYLNAIISEENLVIFDLRKPDDYELGHIPGAINVNNKEFEDPFNEIAAELSTPEQMAAFLSKYGVKNTDKIVVYGSPDRPQMATRLIWSLEVYNHVNTYLLEGHFSAWENDGYEVTTEAPEIAKSNYEIIGHNPRINVDSDYVLNIFDGPPEEGKIKDGIVLLDVRTIEEYEGTREGNKKLGHIPGAVHLYYLDTTTSDGFFLPLEELKEKFEKLGITGDEEVVVYCQSSHRASHTWFVLQYILGHNNVVVYDGAMVEWGNFPGFPVIDSNGNITK